MQAQVAEYHNLKLEIGHLEKKMMAEITRPERVLYYLLPGRLVWGHFRHSTYIKANCDTSKSNV